MRHQTSPTSGLAALSLLLLLPLTNAQQPGSIPEINPQLPTAKCTTANGCVPQNTSITVDFAFRSLHSPSTNQSCTTSTGALDTTLCPDTETCAQNCVIEGANYTAMGVATTGDAMTLNQYVANATDLVSASPRVYLLDNDSGDYVRFQLRGQELTLDVDVSALPCGENGALYLSEMDISGGRSQYQTGGARYGAGYCDAQCPTLTFKNGTVNSEGEGYCCNEMDILESNSMAEAFTPHPCLDDVSDCDKSGCGWNSYKHGVKDYWAPGGTLDTNKPFTVTTQFITDDGTTTGTLVQIKRIYQQGNVTLPSAVAGGDFINSTWCSAEDSAIDTYGNLATMGEALDRGMVLTFSIWNDNSQFMSWLDQDNAGPCNATEGDPALIKANNPGTHVVFSNIRWGDIGSTTA